MGSLARLACFQTMDSVLGVMNELRNGERLIPYFHLLELLYGLLQLCPYFNIFLIMLCSFTLNLRKRFMQRK